MFIVVVWQGHCWTVHVSGWCHVPSQKQGGTTYYSRHQTLGISCMADLHLKTPSVAASDAPCMSICKASQSHSTIHAWNLLHLVPCSAEHLHHQLSHHLVSIHIFSPHRPFSTMHGLGHELNFFLLSTIHKLGHGHGQIFLVPSLPWLQPHLITLDIVSQTLLCIFHSSHCTVVGQEVGHPD